VFAVALLAYTELASFFPGRSGAEVVFLVRVPSEKGHANVFFWYATCVALFLLQPCAVDMLILFLESRYLVVEIVLLLVGDILTILHLIVT
jgi:hypothetical protein